jgi:hypothetical protein
MRFTEYLKMETTDEVNIVPGYHMVNYDRMTVYDLLKFKII